jgi:hypothetical protein
MYGELLFNAVYLQRNDCILKLLLVQERLKELYYMQEHPYKGLREEVNIFALFPFLP